MASGGRETAGVGATEEGRLPPPDCARGCCVDVDPRGVFGVALWATAAWVLAVVADSDAISRRWRLAEEVGVAAVAAAAAEVLGCCC